MTGSPVWPFMYTVETAIEYARIRPKATVSEDKFVETVIDQYQRLEHQLVKANGGVVGLPQRKDPETVLREHACDAYQDLFPQIVDEDAVSTVFTDESVADDRPIGFGRRRYSDE